MIAPHRSRHRVVFILLALLLPAGFVMALAARPELPTSTEIPLAADERVETGVLVDESDALLDGALVLRVFRGEARRSLPILELEPAGELTLPDALIYWTAGTATDALPEDARLVGTIGGLRARRLRLPVEVRDGPSAIVLYSLAHDGILASHPLPHIPADHR